MQSVLHDTVRTASENYAEALNEHRSISEKPKRDTVFVIENDTETGNPKVTELKVYRCENGILSCVRDNGVRITVKIADAYTDRAEAAKEL